VTHSVYDEPGFFAAYSGLERSRRGLEGAPEWPSLRALLPPVRGARVLDLGCGFGWFARWAAAEGAASVLGIDLSARMLARARAETAAPQVTYRQGDLDALAVPEGGFDLVYSSLAFHYVVEFGRLAAAIRAALVPGGSLVFSIEHPVFMASAAPGWVTRADGGRSWTVDSYAREGARTTDWLAPGVVKQHRRLGTTLGALIAAGLSIRAVEEWAPSAAQVAAKPALAEELERPTFVLIAAVR
jgi:SAM-dependent methyltransferase